MLWWGVQRVELVERSGRGELAAVGSSRMDFAWRLEGTTQLRRLLFRRQKLTTHALLGRTTPVCSVAGVCRLVQVAKITPLSPACLQPVRAAGTHDPPPHTPRAARPQPVASLCTLCKLPELPIPSPAPSRSKSTPVRHLSPAVSLGRYAPRRPLDAPAPALHAITTEVSAARSHAVKGRAYT